MSDNGSAFVSGEFKEFMQRNGIKHLTTALYHPSSNGLAERAVQTVKEGLKRMKGPLEARLPRFLLKYRVTPQATTGIAPTELLMGCRIRTYLDLLYPTTRQRVRDHQIQQKKSGDTKAHTRQFNQGDRIMGRNFADGPKWLPGKVLERGKTIVKVKLDDGRIWRRHVNHLLPSQVQIESESIDQECAPPMSLDN